LNVDLFHFLIPFSLSQALERLSFGKSTIRDTLVAQNRILLFWYCTTYLLLEKNKPKYQQLETTPPIHGKPRLKLEELNSEQVDQTHEAPEVSQTGSESDEPLESTEADPVGSFILEGL
jgi:hypothetical protein